MTEHNCEVFAHLHSLKGLSLQDYVIITLWTDELFEAELTLSDFMRINAQSYPVVFKQQHR